MLQLLLRLVLLLLHACISCCCYSS
jgi:hypothetical protein